MEHGGPNNRAFLSVIAWPDGAGREDAVALVEEGLAAHPVARRTLSTENIRLRAAMQPPVILGLLDAPSADAVCRTVCHYGGDAFAPTYADLTALGPTLKIRDLALTGGDLDVAIWRGPECRIKRDSIVCLVRAHLSDTAVVRTPHRGRISQIHMVSSMPRSVRQEFMQDAATRRIQTSDKLDIHTIDGSVFQLDGDKFGYQVLGDMKGHSDKENMDRMFELLQHIAGHAVADMYFPLWKPPPGYDRLEIPYSRLNNDDPAFAFYSRWCALMYRHLLDQPH